MGRSPCCAKVGLNRGAWTAHEDRVLTEYIKVHGEGRWRNLPKRAGLKRCGKSCRLRWLNYLRPDIKRGNISQDEEELIIRLHKLLGNRWSLIAGRLPGRTDNEIKNYWNTNLGKKVNDRKINNSYSNQIQSTSSAEKETKKPTKLEMSRKNSGSALSDQSNKIGANVIRTKAVKFTKVFMNPMSQNIDNNNKSEGELKRLSVGEDYCNNFNTSTAGGYNNPDVEGNILKGAETEHNYTTSSSSTSDFVMNFKGDEFCLSDLLINSSYISDNYMTMTMMMSSDDIDNQKDVIFKEEMLMQDWNSNSSNGNVIIGESNDDEIHNFHFLTSFLDDGDEEWLARSS